MDLIMENKYYVPNIEEFCVGFEYEELGNIGGWYKTQFGDNNGEYNNELSECYWNLTHNRIRVKSLNKEDIESLGFIFQYSMDSKILNTKGNLFYNDNLNLTLFHYPSLNKVTIITKDPSLNEFLLKSVWDDKQVNLITIKTKTELIKLLKQLEI